MSEWMRQVLESKRGFRRRLASLPITEKLRLLEELRARTLAIRAARRTQKTQPVR